MRAPSAGCGGARDNSYTAGVDRAKVARYSERVHYPDHMAALGLDDGDRIRVGTRRADLLVYASQFADKQPGVVIIESVWPNSTYEEGLVRKVWVSTHASAPTQRLPWAAPYSTTRRFGCNLRSWSRFGNPSNNCRIETFMLFYKLVNHDLYDEPRGAGRGDLC